MYTLDAKEQQCYDLIKAGKKQEAIDLCDQFLKMCPDEYGIIRLKGQALESLNRFKEAIVEYDKYLEVFSDDWNICFDKGFSYYSLDMYEEAIEAFDEAFRINPGNYDALKYKRLAENELYNTPGQKFNHRHHQRDSDSDQEQYYHSESSEPSDLSELDRYQVRKNQEEELSKLRKQQRQENPVDSDDEDDYEQKEYYEEPMQEQGDSEQQPKQMNQKEQNDEPKLSSKIEQQFTIQSDVKPQQQLKPTEQSISLYSNSRYNDYHNALLYVLGLTMTGSQTKSLFYSNRIKEKLIDVQPFMIPEFYRILHPIIINMYGDMQSQFISPIPPYQIATSMKQVIHQLFSYDYDEGLLVNEIEKACITITNFFGQTIRRRCDPTLKVENDDSMHQKYDKDRIYREDKCSSFYYHLKIARIQIAQNHNVKLFENPAGKLAFEHGLLILGYILIFESIENQVNKDLSVYLPQLLTFGTALQKLMLQNKCA